MTVATLLAISLLFALPALTLANSHNEQNSSIDSVRAQVRGVTLPPLIVFLHYWENEYGWLPPGLARLLERYEDHFGPIDDDDDDDDGDNINDPELDNVTEDVNDTTATLQFEFSEDVQGRLFVGTETGFGNNDEGVMRVSHTAYASDHEFALEDLASDTEYFYRVRFRDEDNNTIMSDEMSFTTDAEDDSNGDDEDTTDPVVESLTATAGTSTVEVEVVLDEPSRVRLLISEVDGFSTDTEDVMEFNHTEYLTEHTFEVDGLTPDTEYFYRIRYQDEAGNAHFGEQMSFTTDAEDAADTTGPVISDIAGEAGTTTITGTFVTDEPAQSSLYTATTSGFSIDDAGVILTDDAALKTSHELTITGLASSTTYYHIIVVEDEAGNTTESSEFTFGTI